MGGQGTTEETSAGRKLVSRRAVNIGAAWSVPVILTAVAAPTASASPGSVEDPPGTGTAVFSGVVADKGEDANGNRTVTIVLSFTNVTGTNQVRITAVSGGYPWTPMPTPYQTVTKDGTVSFFITRPGTDNSALRLDITYELNGVPKTIPQVEVKNVVVQTGKP